MWSYWIRSNKNVWLGPISLFAMGKKNTYSIHWYLTQSLKKWSRPRQHIFFTLMCLSPCLSLVPFFLQPPTSFFPDSTICVRIVSSSLWMLSILLFFLPFRWFEAMMMYDSSYMTWFMHIKEINFLLNPFLVLELPLIRYVLLISSFDVFVESNLTATLFVESNYMTNLPQKIIQTPGPIQAFPKIIKNQDQFKLCIWQRICLLNTDIL